MVMPGSMRPLFGHLSLLLLPLLLVGCAKTVHFATEEIHECPAPFVPCNPGTFDAITIDTSSDGYGFYPAIAQVDGLNGEPDEFGVAFYTTTATPNSSLRNRATATTRTARGVDGITNVTFDRVTRARIGDTIGSREFVGAIGTPALLASSSLAIADSIVLSGQFPGRVRGDYDLAVLRNNGNGPVDQLDPGAAFITWQSQPAFTPDGQTLYFAGDQLDGIGGTDIYRMRLQSDGTWSDPEKLGAAVNTPCDELFPFVSSDGRRLYFSSAGHNTVGGYDIFRSQLVGGEPGRAENLGRPINTPADELYPTAPPGTDPDTLLYYGSNQAGSQGFDVYVLHRRYRGRPGDDPVAERPDSVRIGGQIVTSDGDPVDGAVVTVDERDPPRRIDSTTTDRDGRYEVTVQEGKRYDITGSKEGKLYGSETVEIPIYNNRDRIEQDIVFADTVVFRVNFPFNDAENPYEFTLDDNGLPTDLRWNTVIDRAAEVLRKIDPASGTRIDLVGHTDPVGSAAYNEELGRQRATFIRRELIVRGVSPTLLSVRSAGEATPLRTTSGETDEQYHARLRRVEMYRKSR